jgi:hypothetical protein
MSIPFRQAKHYRKGPRSVDLVVIHSAEFPEGAGGAEALMNLCAENTRVASWHYAADNNSITQSVREEDIAFHAPGANNNGVGIELCGYARQSSEDWADDFSHDMLGRVAGLTASICLRWNVPVQWVDAEGLLEGRRGITTHAMVSTAFKKSDHMDPGRGFPMEPFLERVRMDIRNVAPPTQAPASAEPPSRPRLARGAKGTAVVELQRRLNASEPSPSLGVDGDFGPLTETALRSFQQASGIPATGAADDCTWAALPPLAA